MHLRDVEEFKETFDSQLAASLGGGHVTSDPAISLVDGGVIRVDGEMHTARNGTTAALVDTLMANKNLVSANLAASMQNTINYATCNSLKLLLIILVIKIW